jgi:hypothetical protein
MQILKNEYKNHIKYNDKLFTRMVTSKNRKMDSEELRKIQKDEKYEMMSNVKDKSKRFYRFF